MLGIATILQRLKAICFQVLSYVMALTHKLHLKTIGAYLITQVTQFAVRIKSPACSDLVENQTTACTLPHYSGAVNQSRTLVVLQTLGQLGQKLATIARKTLQRVKQAY
jgi:hypothetical protein